MPQNAPSFWEMGMGKDVLVPLPRMGSTTHDFGEQTLLSNKQPKFFGKLYFELVVEPSSPP